MSERNVYSIARNENETINFKVREYKGKNYFDIRLFFKEEDGSEMIPTKKGITLHSGLLNEFKHGMAKIEKALQDGKANAVTAKND